MCEILEKALSSTLLIASYLVTGFLYVAVYSSLKHVCDDQVIDIYCRGLQQLN